MSRSVAGEKTQPIAVGRKLVLGRESKSYLKELSKDSLVTQSQTSPSALKLCAKGLARFSKQQNLKPSKYRRNIRSQKATRSSLDRNKVSAMKKCRCTVSTYGLDQIPMRDYGKLKLSNTQSCLGLAKFWDKEQFFTPNKRVVRKLKLPSLSSKAVQERALPASPKILLKFRFKKPLAPSFNRPSASSKDAIVLKRRVPCSLARSGLMPMFFFGMKKEVKGECRASTPSFIDFVEGITIFSEKTGEKSRNDMEKTSLCTFNPDIKVQ